MPQDVSSNHIISRLLPKDRALLEPDLEEIDLPKDMMLEASNLPLSHAYFPFSGIASTVVAGPGGRKIEVGILGREGMSGTGIVMQAKQAPGETIVQFAGKGQRIAAEALEAAFERSRTLERFMMRYAQVQYVQATQTAASNGYGRLQERLARGLLMYHDRIPGDDLPVTHKSLSKMLGVRRASVTVALHALEGSGVIRSDREQISVLDSSVAQTGPRIHLVNPAW